jgi:hypothetical protein
MLITKSTSHRPSAEVSLRVLDQDVLRDGFTQDYIDPHESVMKIAQGLTENMSEYCADPLQYVAPYTSLVTSSMMGKTRLMKELAKYLPIVYLCFREQQGESGYPPATANLLSWFREGACSTLEVEPDSLDIVADHQHIIPTLKHSLFLLYLLKELNDTVQLLLRPKKENRPTYLTLLESGREDFRENFEWMWTFFADHDQTIVNARNRFFARVLNSAETKFQSLRSPEAKDENIWRLGDIVSVQKKWASDYLTIYYPEELRHKYQKLLKSLLEFCPKLPTPITDSELTLIICFDEAHHLCTSSGSLEYVRKDTWTGYGDPIKKQSEEILFSNFQAMRRALRFLSEAVFIPRVFGLFTDTTSRLYNFRSAEDRSLRLINLPDYGTDQFKPIYLFTSIDAHSQMTPQNYAVSDPKEVAKFERLLKFGRAGWYSLYTGKSKASPGYKYYTKNVLKKVAIAKLLSIPVEPVSKLATELQYVGAGEMAPRMRLRLLAVLAPRLALTASPFTSEAAQMVSSHLAVVLRTDKEHHFLQTFYPSEPILAEASATITKRIGWAPLVRALYDQIQNGIVSASRRDSLTKILLLMAMDDTLKPDLGYEESPYWEHTQPVKVKDFLDNWLAPPNPYYRSFSHALSETADLKPCSEYELKRFMNGHVFFTHFVRLDCAVSPRSIACAWNQGAALIAKEGTESFDHIIPVMLAGGTDAPTFGRLHYEWDQQELARACSNVSFILINSKMNQDRAADKCIPTKKNFENFKIVNNAKVMFLSIAQDFDPHRIRREPLVNIKGRGIRNSSTYQQIRIVLKGLGPGTYQCLRDNRSLRLLLTLRLRRRWEVILRWTRM